MGDGVVGLEMAVAVVELADTAMMVLERRQEHSAVVLAREQEIVATEEALQQERLENHRLRSALALSHKVLGEFQRCGFLELMQQLDGLDATEFQERLKKKVESREFLEKMCSLHIVKDGDAFPATSLSEQDCSLVRSLANENDMCGQDFDAGDAEGYIVVTQEDIYDGIACFLARFVSTMPKAKDMSPQELQEAMSKAFVSTKKGIFKRLWSYGKILYTAASWTTTAVGLYQNPFLIRTVFMTIWTTICILLQFLK